MSDEWDDAIPLRQREVPHADARIVAAACSDGGVVFVGWRHGAIIQRCFKPLGRKMTNECQGFVDQRGYFWSRETAALIAHRAGQIKEPAETIMSEELWGPNGEPRPNGWEPDSTPSPAQLSEEAQRPITVEECREWLRIPPGDADLMTMRGKRFVTLVQAFIEADKLRAGMLRILRMEPAKPGLDPRFYGHAAYIAEETLGKTLCESCMGSGNEFDGGAVVTGACLGCNGTGLRDRVRPVRMPPALGAKYGKSPVPPGADVYQTVAKSIFDPRREALAKSIYEWNNDKHDAIEWEKLSDATKALSYQEADDVIDGKKLPPWTEKR